MNKDDLFNTLVGIYFKKCYVGFGEITQEEHEFISQDIACIPTGKNGSDYDQEHIQKHLELGKEYSLYFMSVGQSSSILTLKEFPGLSFNTVCFDYKVR